MVAPVLHELAWQLHSVPLHPADPTAHPFFLRCKHVLQCVAKLMEKGLHLPEGHQRWLITNGRALIAHHVCYWKPDGLSIHCKQFAASLHLIHPGPSSLLCWPTVRVKIEICQWLSRCGANLKEHHAAIPDRSHTVHSCDGHPEEPCCEAVQAVHDSWQCKVWTCVLLLEFKQGFLEPLAPEAHVPVPQLPLHTLLGCKLLNLCQVSGSSII
mmetsp:Transcript_27179/g.32981  ORF Transcript_27179/g.32981 Transcript_27179/m.32981 type:complete len:212 (-) Transcript_27179:1364-1999(-)